MRLPYNDIALQILIDQHRESLPQLRRQHPDLRIDKFMFSFGSLKINLGTQFDSTEYIAHAHDYDEDLVLVLDEDGKNRFLKKQNQYGPRDEECVINIENRRRFKEMIVVKLDFRTIWIDMASCLTFGDELCIIQKYARRCRHFVFLG